MAWSARTCRRRPPLAGKIDNGSGALGTTLTTSGANPNPPLVVGTAVSGAGVGAGTVITAVLTGTGTAGSTYQVNNPQLVATAESMTNAGTIGSAGAPVSIFAFPQSIINLGTVPCPE